MYHVEGRLLKMPVCVVLASLRSCNVDIYAKPIKLRFRPSSRNRSVLHTCGVGKQCGDC